MGEMIKAGDLLLRLPSGLALTGLYPRGPSVESGCRANLRSAGVAANSGLDQEIACAERMLA